MNLPPTRERAPSREAVARSCSPRSGDRQAATGGDPRSWVGPTVLRTGARPPCQFAAAWVAPHPGNAAGTMAANDEPPPQPRYVHRVPRKTAPRASPRPIPKRPRGPPGGPRPVLASAPDGGHRPVCRFLLPLWGFATLLGRRAPGTRLGQARGWAGHGSAAAMLPIETQLPKRRTRAMAARSRCGAKKGCRRQRAICIGRQQGSLFPAPLHSTIWATTKNWTRQRRK
jgi:hypothetical protein